LRLASRKGDRCPAAAVRSLSHRHEMPSPYRPAFRPQAAPAQADAAAGAIPAGPARRTRQHQRSKLLAQSRGAAGRASDAARC
jgi:hypothetical protein